MTRKETKDFIVDSKGYCFLCLDLIPGEIKYGLDSFAECSMPNPSSPCSLESLVRYLKLDMSKVFNQTGSIPTHLLARVIRSRLKATLCEDCANLAGNISVLCKRLEKVQMEITSCLEGIKGKLTKAEVKEENMPELINSNEMLQIVESLRNETLDKCNEKLVNISPRIKVKRLKRREIEEEKVKFRKILKGDINPQSGSVDGLIMVEMDLVLGKVDDDVDAEDDAFWGGQQEKGSYCSDSDKPFIPTEESTATVDQVGTSASGVVVKMEYNTKFSQDLANRKKKRRGHRSSHTSERTCRICKITFRDLWGLKLHVKRVHEDTGKSFKCPECPSFFSGSSQLGLHTNRLHGRKSGGVTKKVTKKVPTTKYPCGVCGKPYSHQYMDSHMIVHTESNRAFKCSKCPSFFTSFTHLRKHETRYHNLSPGEKGFSCPTCGKRVDRWAALEVHATKVHGQTLEWSPELEDSCRATSSGRLVTRNILPGGGSGSGPSTTIRRKFKSHLCTICKVPFSDSYSLKIHMVMHQQRPNAPWKCPHCPSFFTKRYALVGHMNRAHGLKLMDRWTRKLKTMKLAT